jgi:hypothetical protein
LKRKQAQNPNQWAGEAHRNNETDKAFIESGISFCKSYRQTTQNSATFISRLVLEPKDSHVKFLASGM